MSLKNSTGIVLETCMAVKPEEVVLVITDTAPHPSIASALYDRAVELDCDPILMTMEPKQVHGQEPPKAVAEAMAAADVALGAHQQIPYPYPGTAQRQHGRRTYICIT